MKFEDLDQSQVVLLALLVSFVSSVATGIITTSLLAQAPVEVTNTINRVVERTVAPVVGSPKEVTLRKEDQQLLASVSSATQLVVKIAEMGTSTPAFTGVIVSKEGLVVSGAQGIALDKGYYAILSDSSKVSLEVVTSSSKDNLTVFKIVTAAAE